MSEAGGTEAPASGERRAASGERRAASGEHWTADSVQRLRAYLDVSQAELAARVGTRQQTISEWETGARVPRRMSRRLLHLVAEASGFYGFQEANAGIPGTPPPDLRASTRTNSAPPADPST